MKETMLITEFYKNRELFITGGTGYLGKSLIEKLLRECPDISKMYLLIRTKKNKTPLERLKEFSNDLVFERLHREQPKAFEKVIPIAGDSVELGMGISQEDMERLKNVNIIIHGAANVRFDNNLRESILMNTRGTHELLKIAVTLKQLIAFIHISTAFINPFISYIKEKIYDAPVNWRSALNIAETYDDETHEILKLKYTKYYPNAYCFTKNLSEQVVVEFADKLPITILRPSIVAHSMRDPEPGYIDNLNGPMGLLVAISLGISQITYCNGDLIMAMIHVDAITDLTIIATYKRGLETMNKHGLDIRNLTPGTLYKHTLSQSTKIYLKHASKEPFEKTLWAPTGFMSTNYYLFIMCVLFVNIPLALVYDVILMLSKEKRMVLKLTRKFVYTSKVVEKYSHDFFEFQNDGMWDLFKSIPEKEIDKFGTIRTSDDNHIDIDVIMKNLHDGVKKYIFKEPIKATAATKRRYKIIIMLDKIIKLFIFIVVIGFVWKMVN